MSFKNLNSATDSASDYARRMDEIKLQTMQDMMKKNAADFTSLLTNSVADASSKENNAISQSKLQF